MEMDWIYLSKPTGVIENEVLDWNPQVKRRKGRPRKTWKRTVKEETSEGINTRSEVKTFATKRTRWQNCTGILCSLKNQRNLIK